MSNYIIMTLDKLEGIERKHGTLGTVIGVILIILTLNCRKAPFFRYGDIRQGFIKML